MISLLLRQMSIRGRLISLVVVPLALITGLFILLIRNQSPLTDQLQQVTNVESKAERTLLLASVRVLSARVNLMRYLNGVVPNPGEALEDIDQARDLLNLTIPLLNSPEQEATIEAVLLGIEEYKILIGKIHTANNQGMGDEVAALLSEAHQKELDLEQRIEAIVAENAQRQAETNTAVINNTQRWSILLISGYIGVMILALVAVALVERTITRPVNALRDGVEALRSGQLETLIPIQGKDELSWLARVFNLMTAQIAKSYTELEQRVAERTQAVEARALQLQVAAEVARDAASVRNLDSLLYRAVQLIQARFNFYYVSIYLIDDLGKFAVLQAATGEAGRSFIQREHKLRVGEAGIVGYVTGVGAPRIVNDVDADFVYRRDTLLPETRSEMALPLKIGNSVIGALDVQSSELNTFGEDELTALQILVDQLAVAIKNTRLVGELEERLSEINMLYRRYTQESLARVTHGRGELGFHYDLLSVQSGQVKFTPDVMEKLHLGQKVVIHEEIQGVEKSRLLVPLMLYDQMVGVLGFDEDDPEHEWSADELAIIEAVSNQVIMALDNARLLDETQLRTDQLRLLQEITATAVAHTSLRELVADVSQKLRIGLEVERCVIAMMDPGGTAVTRVATASAHELPSEAILPGVKIPIGENDLVRQVMVERKSVARYEEEGLPLPTSGLDLPSQPTIQSVVLIPLMAREAVIGLIKLDVTDPERRFSEEDLRLFDQLSLQISTAVEVARSIEQTTARAEQERIISEVTARMRETLDVESVLRTAVDEIFRIGGFTDVSIVLGTDDRVEDR
jgi:GAF domain-containing protein/HAMP domain-containing protein